MFPQSSQDVADDLDTRLVVVGIDRPHTKRQESPALTFAKEVLEWRGSAPRVYKNTLVFLAADRARLQDLDQAVRRYLAWESILGDRERLNLSPHQVRQAEQQKAACDVTVRARLPETFQWLLVPVQSDPNGPVEWQEIRLQGDERLAVRASRRLVREELLLQGLAGTRLRMELDRIPLWRGDHVAVRQLVEDFARYLYLPRLKDPSVLVEAVQDKLALLTWEQESFAYADDYDEGTGRYRGLRAAQNVRLAAEDPRGLVVKPEVARRQMEREAAMPSGERQTAGERAVSPATPATQAVSDGTAGFIAAEPVRPRRFHGTVALDPLRVGADAGRIAQEVISHLAALPGAQVEVTLEIAADFAEGVPDHVVRIVTENARTLKFLTQGFEQE